MIAISAPPSIITVFPLARWHHWLSPLYGSLIFWDCCVKYVKRNSAADVWHTCVHWRTVHACTCVHRLSNCTHVHNPTLQVFRGSCCKVLHRKFIYTLSTSTTMMSFLKAFNPDIITWFLMMRGLHARDFHPLRFSVLSPCLFSLPAAPAWAGWCPLDPWAQAVTAQWASGALQPRIINIGILNFWGFLEDIHTLRS